MAEEVQSASPKANNLLGAYIQVTLAYWLLMLGDGALRMLVLLYFHELGFGPMVLAGLFVLYELCGVVTNALAAQLAQRRGLKITLLAGLFLQAVAFGALSFFNEQWPTMLALSYVVGAQALSGMAKDLTKMSSKTAVKFLAPDSQDGKLFRWVAVLTGSKNTVKGLGFFFGAFLLSACGFQDAFLYLALVMLAIFIWSSFAVPQNIGEYRKKESLKSFLSPSTDVRSLSLARIALFAARDVWFVVALPIFAAEVLGWSELQIGAYLAYWIIGYGVIQAFAPRILRMWKQEKPDGGFAQLLAYVLMFILAVPTALFFAQNNGLLNVAPEQQQLLFSLLLIGSLSIFGIVFALNSSVHSYLIVSYAEHERAASQVGFYYMANAVGRLIGTIASGVSYAFGGIFAALLCATLLSLMAGLLSMRLPRDRSRILN